MLRCFQVRNSKQEVNDIVYIYYNFLINPSSHGHLGCFHVLAIVNSAAMNIGKRVSFNFGFLSVYAHPTTRDDATHGHY